MNGAHAYFSDGFVESNIPHVLRSALTTLNVKGETVQLRAGELVYAHFYYTHGMLVTSEAGHRVWIRTAQLFRARFAMLTAPVVADAGMYSLGTTVYLNVIRSGRAHVVAMDGRAFEIGLHAILLIPSSFDNVFLPWRRFVEKIERNHALTRVPPILLAVHTPLARLMANEWFFAYRPPGGERFPRGRSQLVVEIVAIVQHWNHSFGGGVARAVLSRTQVDLSSPIVPLQMPANAMCDVFPVRRALDSATRFPLFSVRTIVVASLTVDDVLKVNGRMIALLRSVGGTSPVPMTLVEAVSPAVQLQPSMFSSMRPGTVVGRMLDTPVVRPLEPFGFELTFMSSLANINDAIVVDSYKVQLFQREFATVNGTTKSMDYALSSVGFPGFKLQYNRNGNDGREASTTIRGLTVPLVEVCSGSLVDDRGSRFELQHYLRVKLYLSKFSKAIVLKIRCVLGLPNHDARAADAPPPHPPLYMQEVCQQILLDPKYDDVAVPAGAAVAAAPADREDVPPPPADDVVEADNRDARRDHWLPAVADAAPEVVPQEQDAELANTLRRLARHKCRECEYSVESGKLRRKHIGCSKYQRHLTELGEYQRLQRLVSHVSIKVCDIETDKVFFVEMAPLASRDGLVWRIEETCGRRVKALTLLGSPVPPDATMSGLVGLDIEVDLAPPDTDVKCVHCNTQNEAGLMFCKNCAHLIPARLVRTAYEPTMELPECVICFDSYEEGHLVTYLPCMHGFHADCLADWLARKTSCPVCSSEITPESISLK